jgi:O-antigen/teichoic acid export membrane protein
MKKKAVFHNILGAFSNFIFLFLTSIVLLPYYFRFISSADYGIWLGGISFLSLVSVLEANISFILTQQLADKWTGKQPLEFSKYLSSAVLFGVAASALIITATFFLKETLSGWVSSGKPVREIFSDSFFLYAVSLSFTITFGYINSVTQVFLRTLLTPVFNIIGSICGIAYTIIAIPTQGILAIAMGNLVKSIVYSTLVGIYVIILLKEKQIPFCFELSYLWKLIRNIGLPFISKVGMTLAVSIQNFIVATTISASATTMFDITKKLPLMVQMFINMITVSTFTSFSLFYSEQKNHESRHEYTNHYFTFVRILLLIPLAMIFLIGQDFVTVWVGPDKFGGNILLALLCMTALSDQLRLILAQQYYAIGKFNLTSITDTIFALSFMIIAFLLIPHLKLSGIVLAGILANICYFTACLFLEKRNKVSMVPNIINRQLLFDMMIVLLISAASKTVYEAFRGNHAAGAATVSCAMIVLCAIFYVKEKALLNFMFLKFGKSSSFR